MWQRLLTGAFSIALTLATSPVLAATAYESPYTYEQTFGSALRLLRVDLGLKITERDTENGILFFDYKSPESGKRTSHGAVELVRTNAGVRVSVELPSMPQYHEQMIVDILAKKLSREHGEPNRPKPEEKKPIKTDPPPSEG